MQAKTKKNGFMLALWLLALVCVVLNFLGVNRLLVARWFADSDNLYLSDLFGNLFKGGHLSDWFFTPAPYFFPDYPLYFVAYLLGGSVHSQLIICALLQLVLALAVIWFVAKQCRLEQPFFIAAPVMIFFLVLAFGVGSPYYLVMRNTFHFGAFLMGIVVVALSLIYRRRLVQGHGHSGLVLVLMAAVSYLTGLSDGLFLVEGAAALVATEAVMALVEWDLALKKWLPALVVLVFAALGMLSYPVLVDYPTRYTSELSLWYFFDRLPRVFLFALKTINYNILPMITLAAYVALVIYGAIFFRKESKTRPELFYLLVFSFCSLCLTLFAVCASVKLLPADRHLLALFCLPIIVVFLYFGNFLAGKGSLGFSVISLCLVGLLAMGTTAVVQKNGLHTQYYPDGIACVDQALSGEDVSHGIAEYWTARPQQLFGKLPLTIATFQRKGVFESHWITSQKYFHDSYDFALVPTDDPTGFHYFVARLIELNGQPKAVKQCFNALIYIYPKGGIHKFDIIRHPGQAIDWQAKVMNLQTIQLPPAQNPSAGKIFRRGFPWVFAFAEVGSGDYRLRIDYKANGSPQDQKQPGWEVSTEDLSDNQGGSWPTPVLQAKGPMPRSDGKPTQAQGSFHLDTGKDLVQLDIRVWAPKGSKMKVSAIHLERVR